MIRYWKTLSVLLQEAVEHRCGWWPWTVDHIVSGDMERSFLTFILVSEAHVNFLNSDNNVQILHVSSYVLVYSKT